MFADVQGLFAADGVPADLVRAGEPRLRTSSTARRDTAWVAAGPARLRLPLLRRLGRLAAA